MGLQLPLPLLVDVAQLFLLIIWSMTHLRLCSQPCHWSPGLMIHPRFCSHAHSWFPGQQSPLITDLLCCLGWNVFGNEFTDVFVSPKLSLQPYQQMFFLLRPTPFLGSSGRGLLLVGSKDPFLIPEKRACQSFVLCQADFCLEIKSTYLTDLLPSWSHFDHCPAFGKMTRNTVKIIVFPLTLSTSKTNPPFPVGSFQVFN